MIILNIIIFILVIGSIILVHELGHFICAKKAGILCHEFSIGMGPVIYKKVKGETTYCIRAIPLGGYVSMAGEQITADTIKIGMNIGLNLKDGCVYELVLDHRRVSDVSGEVISCELYSKYGEALEITLSINGENKTYPVLKDAFYVFTNGTLQIAPYDRSFDSKPVSKRFITILAGAIMNFVLAIILYFICYLSIGVPDYSSTVISSVSEYYPSSEVLEVGDEITSIASYEVTSWDDITDVMDKLTSEAVTSFEVTYIRDGQTLTSYIDATIVINSVGLSNLNIDETYASIEYDGVMLGSNALNYVDSVSDDDVQLSNGDIIQKVRIDNVTSSGVSYGEFVSVSSWGDLITLFEDVDVSYVYFQYYDQQTQTVQNTYTSGDAVESYGDELLVSQSIEKISLMIGVSPVYHFDFLEIVKTSFSAFVSDFTLIFRTLKLLVNPSGIRQVGVSNLSGFVGIFDMISDVSAAGIISLLLFTALLSVNIGVMNLLPIPALDGGRLVFLAYEGITKKPINKKIETTLNNIMFILLMILFVYVTFNDIINLFK